MDVPAYEAALMKFLEQGGGFFSWFQGKNTPNILSRMAEQLTAIEGAIKASTQPKKVLEYTYLFAPDLADLWAAVQRHMKEGWQPVGNLLESNTPSERRFIQPMAKYENGRHEL